MFITTHVAAGALIGRFSPSAPSAFLSGIASHFALDAIPHFGFQADGSGPNYLPAAVVDGLLGLSTIALLTSRAPSPYRTRVLAAMAGASLVDLDKPSLLFFNRAISPAFVDRFHRAIQHESPHRLKQEITTAAILIALASVVLPRHHQQLI